jgi:hypothetical protein
MHACACGQVFICSCELLAKLNEPDKKQMKTVVRLCAVALVAMALSSTAFAGECCKKAAEATKAGKSCEKCTKGACCKEAAKGVKDAKSCEKCAPKK